MDVVILPSELASRFFRREFEKTPSPEKKEQDLESFAEELAAILEKTPSPEKEEQDELVLDLTYLDLSDQEESSFADELAEIEERTAGATVGLPKFRPGDDGKLTELVSQKYIRALMKSPPPSKPLSDYSIEAIRGTGITDEEELETVARGFRALQSARDTQNDIIRQYRAKGYAYVALQ